MRRAFITLLSIAIVCIAVGVLAYFMFNIYLSQSNAVNYTSKDASSLELEKRGKGSFRLITSTKAKTKEINQKLKHREQEVEKALR